MIEWQVGKVVLTSLPLNASAPTCIAKRYVPIGATHWRLPGETKWKLVKSLPKEWREALKATEEELTDGGPEEGT